MRPVVSAYLPIMGLVILHKAVRRSRPEVDRPRRLIPLGLGGRSLDAIDGGGWGPIVTSTLVGNGTTPRYAIGSVNCAEFLITATISATFIMTTSGSSCGRSSPA